MTPEDIQLEEDIKMLESFFDTLKNWTNLNKSRAEAEKQRQLDIQAKKDKALADTKDNLYDTHLDLDSFKNTDEFLQFMGFISNLENINQIKDKKQILAIVRKYKEILDILLIAFPYIKTKARSFGVVIPKMVNENADIRDKLKTIFKS